MLERLERIQLATGPLDLARLQLLEESCIVDRIAEDGHTSVVLGRGPDKGDTTNVDLLYRLWNRDVDLGDGVLEGIEVADDIVDFGNVLLREILLVRCEVSG